MVVTDIQACFAAGALFADLAAPGILASTDARLFLGSAIYARMRQRAVMYPAVFLGPCATLFMLAWPGWESQYVSEAFVATGGDPWNALPFALFLLLLAAGAWFGNWLGFRWVLAGARRRLRAVYGSVVLGTVVLVLARWPAPVRLGTYRQFARDPSAMPYVWQEPTFFVSFWVLTVCCALPLVVLGLRALRENAAARDASVGA